MSHTADLPPRAGHEISTTERPRPGLQNLEEHATTTIVSELLRPLRGGVQLAVDVDRLLLVASRIVGRFVDATGVHPDQLVPESGDGP